MPSFDTRPTEDDIRPSYDTTAPCGLCATDVQGTDGIWVHWDQHLAWHQWLWDMITVVASP